MRAIRPERAAELQPWAAFLCHERRVLDVEIAAEGDAERVREQLEGLEVRSAEQIVVCWSAQTAVLTDWATFCAYWEELCYPSSDDVTVWPRDEAWVLCYDHWEMFRFGRLAPVT